MLELLIDHLSEGFIIKEYRAIGSNYVSSISTWS